MSHCGAEARRDEALDGAISANSGCLFSRIGYCEHIVSILRANRPGKYQVDERCIGCTICSEIAPANFRSDHEHGYDYVYKQPDNALEEGLCAEAMDLCPVNAIGFGGAGGNIGPV